MLLRDVDELGITTYIVLNDTGLCLIRTTNSAIAAFVEKHTPGAHPDLRLMVGGDRGARKGQSPIWTHVRKFTK